MPLQSALRRSRAPRRVRAQRVNCVAVGQCFDIDVTREVDGWVVRIPEVGGIARVGRRAAVELAARKCIANRTGIPIGYVAVYVKSEIG